MILSCVMLSFLWAKMSGQDSKTISEYYSSSMFTITGFRNNNLQKRFESKIEPAALLGGLFVGIVTVISDAIGCLTSGMGLLLCVSTIYDLYEKI
mmetsp:Transcript_44994/g.98296  ORF Transcript_44994/g.98296 Transcript_44994/m.98296 type:complete len:95 (-) Transcript_44994:158-442(-)